MKVGDLLKADCCDFNCTATTKEQLLISMAHMLNNAGCLNSYSKYLETVYRREEEFCTGVGFGLAIPHGKSDSVKFPSLAFSSLKNGIDYGSFDDMPVTIAFMVAVPLESNNLHLEVLAAISRKMVHEDTQEALKKASSYSDVLKVFENVDIQ